jgi:hypothetical protein
MPKKSGKKRSAPAEPREPTAWEKEKAKIQKELDKGVLFGSSFETPEPVQY